MRLRARFWASSPRVRGTRVGGCNPAGKLAKKILDQVHPRRCGGTPKEDGWLMAGQWYWLKSSMSLEQQQLAKATVGYREPEYEKMTTYEETYEPIL